MKRKSVSREEKLKTAHQPSLSRPFDSELCCLEENVIGENAAFSEYLVSREPLIRSGQIEFDNRREIK